MVDARRQKGIAALVLVSSSLSQITLAITLSYYILKLKGVTVFQ